MFPVGFVVRVLRASSAITKYWASSGMSPSRFHVLPLREISEVHREDEEVQRLPVEGSPLLFVKQIDDFVAAALDGRPPAVSLRESRGNTAVLAALHESAKTGRAVTI